MEGWSGGFLELGWSFERGRVVVFSQGKGVCCGGCLLYSREETGLVKPVKVLAGVMVGCLRGGFGGLFFFVI